MPITATFGLIFGVAKVDVVEPTRTRGGREYAGKAESRARTQRQRQSHCVDKQSTT